VQAPAAPRLLHVPATPAGPVPPGVSPCDDRIVTGSARPVTMDGRTVVVPAAAAGGLRRTV
jgi:hypothetical protein